MTALTISTKHFIGGGLANAVRQEKDTNATQIGWNN